MECESGKSGMATSAGAFCYEAFRNHASYNFRCEDVHGVERTEDILEKEPTEQNKHLTKHEQNKEQKMLNTISA